MKAESLKIRSGLTLVEVIIAVLVLAVIAIGALGHSYWAALDLRKAKAELAASRIGQMVIEDWKSTGGKTTADPDGYDPSDYDSGFIYQSENIWRITIDDMTFELTLGFSDVDTDTDKDLTLRQLDTTIQWRLDYADAPITEDDQALLLTTYVTR